MKGGEGTKKIYEKNPAKVGGGTKKTMEGGRRLPTVSLGVEIIRD